ncbi:RING finger protein 10 [Clonorchis sinensis]|uniref:E3 ubiquitin-protein ligase RNF10 n=1 Tax=Clonorchis sinensis TaxID=79923 RepID=A0A8T1MI43_CLOSI|nr:RING finger protein 10 [Clonorchis sinensis]
MENSLVRSVMSVQRTSNPERRDAIQSSNHGYIPRSQRQILRGQIRGGRRTERHREAYSFVVDGAEAIEDEVRSRAGPLSAQVTDPLTSKPCDGFLHAAAQLQLLPGSIGRITGTDLEVFSWDLIAQVVCLVDEPVCCPICLYPPIAPRMERCGHIYCGPCVTKYIWYENGGSAKKCAVCCWIIRLEELKRVSVVHVSPLNVGSKLSMVLVDHLKDHCTRSAGSPVINASTPADIFSFIVEVGEEQLRSAAQDELSVLEAFKSTCIEDGNVELIPEINYMVNQLEASLKGPSSFFQTDCQFEVPLELSGASKNCHAVDSPPSEIDAHNRIYQSADGQPIFLDGLMWKCLLAEYGSVAELPGTLDVTVTSLKTYKMNPVLRKRWRHLKHVPPGHAFSLIEVELDALVSRSTLEQFASALEARSIERDRSRLEDLRLTKLKEAAENRIPSLPEGFVLSGHAPLLGGPSFQSSDFVPLGATSEAIPKASTSAPSFAEVSKMGALAVVDENRVANFARGPLGRRSIPYFDPSSEAWPSLSDVRKHTAGQASSQCFDTSVSPWGLPLNTPVPKDSPTNAEKQDTAAKSNHKKHRRRRTRTYSLRDSSVCE